MSDEKKYVAIIDQEKVTDEVRDIAINYDPINRSGGQGFHIDDEGDLHIEDSKVIEAHKLIEKKIPNDAIRILPLASETGTLIHQYGANSFRLYELPVPNYGEVTGIIGKNGIGKSTAVQIIAGVIEPNLGDFEMGPASDDELIEHFKGTEAQRFLERQRDGEVDIAYKPQRVELIPKKYDGNCDGLLQSVNEQSNTFKDDVIEALSLKKILDRDVSNISGGELQRLAIAATLLKDANVYVLDEPTSYLDIKQRLRMSKFLRSLPDEETNIMVIEHDLIILDHMTDTVHLMYGEEGSYGIVSGKKSTKAGINTYLDGYLQSENVKFRESSISFEKRSTVKSKKRDTLTTWPSFEESFGDFDLEADSGVINRKEVIGVLGENGIGKSSFVKALAGEKGDHGLDLEVAHKPQYLDPDDGIVRMVIRKAVKNHKHDLIEPLNLNGLLNAKLQDLSGGELQRVMVARTLSEDADLYLLDEPSAYLDVEQRLDVSKAISGFMENSKKSAIVVDHDLLFLDYLSDRLMVFEGEPAERGRATGPHSMQEGMNTFLKDIGITFRRDELNNRPRANKEGSVKDREQKENGRYYYS